MIYELAERDRGDAADAIEAAMEDLPNIVIAIGACVTALSAIWAWLSVQRRHLRRTLAFAFVGEISALMREFEIHGIVEKLENAAVAKSVLAVDLSGFTLPNFVAYEAYANRLGLFGNSLTRQMTYFYSRLASLAADFRSLSSQASLVELNAHNALVGCLLAESKEELALADDILRGLRRFLSIPRPNSISRA